MKPATLLATLFLALVSLAHLARVLFQVGLTVGGTAVPLWVSGAAFVFCGALALALARDGRRRP